MTVIGLRFVNVKLRKVLASALLAKAADPHRAILSYKTGRGRTLSQLDKVLVLLRTSLIITVPDLH